MEENKNKNNLEKLERALHESFGEDVEMERGFKRNLDKLVDNTIEAKKLENEKRVLNQVNSQGSTRKSFFATLFSGAKWQVSLLTSFIGILLLGGVAFAAVPELREAIVPTKGKLYVNSVPGAAQVELRGGEYDEYTSVGQTPLEMKLKGGTYDIRLILEDYEEYERSVSVEVGERASFEIKLKEVMKILDTIKEWKTYTDLENGFEFTYPLEWEVKEDEYSLIMVEGENSFFAVYEDSTNIPKYDRYEYSQQEEVKSEDASNKIWVSFYTTKEEEVDIYKFIYSTVKVYDLAEDGTDTWESYENTHFSFKYPNENWVVVEKSRTDHYSEYQVLATEGEAEPLTVYYSYGYLKQLNDYSYESEEYVNGYRVSKYTSEKGNIYEFPNRIYVYFKSSDDSEVNEIYEKVLSSVTLITEDEFQTISDYNNNYLITAPASWSYTTTTNDYEFLGVEYSHLWGQNGNLKIFKWDDVADNWDEFMSYFDEEVDYYQTSQVRISDETYTRIVMWTDIGVTENIYAVRNVQYVKGEFDGNIKDTDFSVTIGESNFVIMFSPNIDDVSDANYISDKDETTLSLFDAVVASMKGLD
jgi:hypothetical protein